MNTFCRILSKYGEETKIEYGGICLNTKTFVQPIVKDGTVKMSHLGKVNDGEFYWFAPAYVTLDMEQNITVTTMDGTFDLIRAEKYRALGRDSHWEGILKRRY